MTLSRGYPRPQGRLATCYWAFRDASEETYHLHVFCKPDSTQVRHDQPASVRTVFSFLTTPHLLPRKCVTFLFFCLIQSSCLPWRWFFCASCIQFSSFFKLSFVGFFLFHAFFVVLRVTFYSYIFLLFVVFLLWHHYNFFKYTISSNHFNFFLLEIY